MMGDKLGPHFAGGEDSEKLGDEESEIRVSCGCNGSD